VIRLTRRYRFAASHRLHSDNLPEDENRAVFGKCNNPYGHGHDYVLEVSVTGPVESESGQAVRLGTLDRAVQETVLAGMDHRNLNAEVEEFRGGLVPTTENLAEVILNRLDRNWGRFFPKGLPRLERIRIYETPRNIFEIANKDEDEHR
jgi:6-pyruvoyltetrahydropterin/6-carboxytetrahydropterin synthase